jgi:hypothetical protein
MPKHVTVGGPRRRAPFLDSTVRGVFDRSHKPSGVGEGQHVADRSSFDMSNLSSANRILLVSSLLLLIDSFLPWQHRCVAGLCVGTINAWSGGAGFLGVLMALAALALLVFVVVGVVGLTAPLGSNEVRIVTWLAAGAVVFGFLRFLFALFNHAALFAWCGLILLVVMAYGAYMRTQEPAPPENAPRTPPRPPTP